ncbi:putative protein-tyrosine phosphatase [Rubidibacter lacunae KORDI 51-2]|uniref:Tyrosine specific protein phosphatases domain-containing protein n=1 Tax=Rubidibacter lacunae KORDI 51-2 TaxID=582515 RepID=U5DH35_9CHRO|nr:dual specificity protein phosphatase [Rubidibacter lacunae]ERN39869.1 putative protein-tyrosine phosphatase [Rubidibacter lacunae KORDI 51-2]
MIKRFSWVLSQKLAVGPFPHSENQAGYLARQGITAVLCLTEPDERDVPSGIFNRFVWERVAIPDGFTGGVPEVEHFTQSLAILTRWHRKGHAVYVHCLAGVGRSPSVCAAYVARTQSIDLDYAIALVKQQHEIANPDSAQVAIMREFLSQSNSFEGASNN